ncbi:MAG: CocE/NonD family hydrolase [Oceanococcus sp.]
MRPSIPITAALIAGLALSACNSDSGGNSAANPSAPTSSIERTPLDYGGDESVASCGAGTDAAGGRAYHVVIPSRVDGENISFELHEPNSIDCNSKHALILQGHGYAGSRTTGVGAFEQYTASGFAVISIDQRGSPDSGGTVRVMDPDFEGEDLVAIVDWAEQYLDWLKYRDGNLLLGSIGGSYGGMYQYLLLNKDPDRRLDAIVPEIAPHDLTYSLNPGGVIKSYWALVLAAAGDSQTQFGQDELIRATLVEGAVTGDFPPATLPFFSYHSMSYFCDNPLDLQTTDRGDTSAYIFDPLFQLLPLTSGGEFGVFTPSPRAVPKVDALLWQGPRDDLFNMNEAWRNYQCLERAGGDVRLLTYSSGHHLLSPNVGLVEMGLASQSLPLESVCGPINKDAAALAWFNDKLLGLGNADDTITTGQDICFALGIGDAVALPDMTVGGTEFPVELPGGLPVLVTLANPVPMIVPLATAGAGGEVLAGIPTAQLTVSRGDASLDEFCVEETDPILRAGTCDTTVFVGLGVIKTGELIPLVPELIEEQVMPVRGIGEHNVEMVGVAERISEGDQIVMLIYGLNDAFVASTSRDALTPTVTVTGTVQVPMQGPLPALTAP